MTDPVPQSPTAPVAPQVLFVTDVLGRTPELESFSQAVAGRGARVLDPFGGRALSFADDTDAYRRYLAEDGPRRLEALVRRHITPETRVIGFSAGAAAAWRALAECPAAGAVLFYGARIRDSLHLRPLCPVQIVLPEREDHFDVAAMGDALEKVAGVRVTRTPWRHGFLNPRSSGWEPAAAAEWRDRLAAWVAGGAVRPGSAACSLSHEDTKDTKRMC